VNEFNIIPIAPFYRNPLIQSPVEALEQYTVSVSRIVKRTNATEHNICQDKSVVSPFTTSTADKTQGTSLETHG
jgi:hypothetical protein